MGKTRNLFKKIGGIKETFHARMDKIKDRNSKDPIESEKITYTLQHTIENTKENIAWGDACSDLPICSCYQLFCPDVTRNLSFQ